MVLYFYYIFIGFSIGGMEISMRNRKIFIKKMIVCIISVLTVSTLFTGCSVSRKEKKTTEATTEEKKSSGVESLIPLENEDFYKGTWEAIFYYDANKESIEEVDDDNYGYFVTFNDKDLLISRGGQSQSYDYTTSDGIQGKGTGNEYYCLYYDVQGQQQTIILTMMNIKGEYDAGFRDGNYLTIMTSASEYIVFEKVKG